GIQRERGNPPPPPATSQILRPLYAMLKKNQQHKQHIWFLQTLKSTQEKPKELFLPTLDRNKN
ncbi:MAG: hypothetical protein PHC38_05785, partial [Weeksellaceae bacterium]|nr:hypothetical protein [Weeksellaceae bacterium]